MRKKHILLACAIVLAIGLGLFFGPHFAQLAQREATTDEATPTAPTTSTQSPETAEDVGSAPAPLTAAAPVRTSPPAQNAASNEHRQPTVATSPPISEATTPPPPEPRLRSTVDIHLKADDILVTGGYMDEQGRIQYAIVRHAVQQRPDGSQAIQLKSQLFAMTPELAEKYGLDSMFTAAEETSQHGEVWTKEEYLGVIEELGTAGGGSIVSAPRVSFLPHWPAKLQIGGYSIDALVDAIDQDGGIQLQLTVEQPLKPQAQ